MNIKDLDDEKILEILEKSTIHFKNSRIDLNSSSLIIKHLVNLIRAGIIAKHIEAENISKMMITLQENVDTELSKKESYEEKVWKRIKINFEKALSEHTKEVFEIFQNRYETLEKRIDLYQNVEELTRLVLREPKSPGKREDEKKRRLIGLSYAYVSLINSIFKYSLQDCYIWDRITTDKKINENDIARKEISDILNHYKQVNDLLFFDGYDLIIKNSVENSNFIFNVQNEKISFFDEHYEFSKQTGKPELVKNESVVSLEEIAEKYEKIESIFRIIMMLNQILVINLACRILSNRYS